MPNFSMDYTMFAIKDSILQHFLTFLDCLDIPENTYVTGRSTFPRKLMLECFLFRPPREVGHDECVLITLRVTEGEEVRKKKKVPDRFKKQVVKEAKETGNLAAVARRHELSTNMVSRWKRELESEKRGDIDLVIVPSFDGEALS